VRLHGVVQDALAMMWQEIGKKQLRVTVQLDAAEQTVMGDDMRLKQIFWNVIKNAVKFTPSGGSITIASENVSADGQRIAVRVTDSGHGLTSEEITRIFAAFAQGDHAAGGNGKFGGLGLGLVISRMLVQLHSGVIRADSAGRNQGATFTVELPVAAERAGNAHAVTPNARRVPVDGVTGPEERRILLVEDHSPTCVTLTELLTRRGFRVVSARSLGEARAAAERHPFDILISDIGLPDGNGCDLMSWVRTRFRVPGIALTGYGMSEDMERSRQAGFVTHLTKPVSVSALDQALAMLAPVRA